MTKKEQNLFYIIILSSSVSFLGASLYFPAMPEMAEYFGVSDNVMEHTVSMFQFGLVLAAIVYGPISDSYGRRRVFLFGYTVFLLGSVLLLFPLDIDSILILRFIQGCGSGVSLGLSQAIIRDHFNQKESARLFAQIGVVLVLTPAVAPMLGGYLTAYFGWWSCFLVTAIAVFFTLTILYLFFEETHAQEERIKLHPAHLLKSYRQLLSKRSFIYFTLINSILFSGLWFYRTVMPFVFIKYMGMSETTFGYYVFAQVIVFSLSSYYIQGIASEVDPDRIIKYGCQLLFFGCFTMLLAILTVADNALLITISYMPFTMGLAFIIPMSSARAMSYSSSAKGAASSLMATTRQFFTAFGSSAAAFLPSHSFLPAIIFLLLNAVAVSYFFYLVDKEDSYAKE